VGGGVGGGTLAVALKRKVALFSYSGSEFIAAREVSLPASPLALAWAGARLVAGGGKKGGWWGLAGAAGGEDRAPGGGGGNPPPPMLTPVELFVSPRGPAAPPSGWAPAPALAVTLWEGGAEDGDGGGAAPSQPPEAVVLTIEAGAAVAAADGGRAGRAGRRLAWRGVGAPAALAASPPYVAACLPGGVEIRPDLGAGAGAAGFSGGSGGGEHEAGEAGGGGGGGGAAPIPALLPGLACMAVAAGASPSGPGCGIGSGAPRPGAPLLVAGGGRVVRLVPAPFGEQADAAAAAGQPAAALALAALVPRGGAAAARAERAERLDRLRSALAASLFGQGEVEEALAVLALVGREREGRGGAGEGGGEAEAGGGGAAPALLALLRLFPSLAPPEELEPIAAELLGAGAASSASAASPTPPLPPLLQPLPPPPEHAGPAGARAAAAVLPYLLSLRGRLGGGGCAAAASSSTAAAALAALVDTAIVRAHLGSGEDDGSLLRFLGAPARGGRQAHHAVPSGGSGEAALRAAGRYAEVVALLQSTGRHEAALDVLKALATDRASLPAPPTGAAADFGGVTAAWAAVRALHAAGAGRRPDLIHGHAVWVLGCDPDAGLGALLELDPPPPPAVALAAVRAGAPSLAAPYLEAALERGIARSDEWHAELVDLYVRACLVGAGGGGRAGEGAGPPPPLANPGRPRPGSEASYARLLSLAATSPHIAPARLLAGLPPGALLAFRAALLERSGDAQGALRLCVFEARDDRAAEGVAARAAARAADPSAAHAPFLSLAQLLVERDGGAPGGDGAPGWAGAARLLARAAARAGGAPGTTTGAAAVDALPDGVPISTALPTLEAALASASAASRAAAVERALRKADGLAARAAAARARGGALVVGPDRACCLCTRRLGVAAFAALPGGRLAHYSCHMQREEAAAGGGGNGGGGV